MNPITKFDPRLDAEVLHKAVAGLGTSEKDIIGILTKRNSLQNQQIAQTYKDKFGKDLLTVLKKDTSGDFYRVIEALLQPPEVNDSHAIHHAIKGLGTDEQTLLEILFNRTNHELLKISQTYYTDYKKPLLEDIIGDVSGGLKQLLVAVISGTRDESSKVDAAAVKADAEALFKAGPKKWGTDMSVFVEIFARRSMSHLRSVLTEFEELCKSDIQKVMTAEMSGDTLMAFLSLVSIIKNKEAYFAERIHNATKGIGTRDGQLIRVIVSSREKYLSQIAKEFEKLFGKNLIKTVEEETSGDYRDILSAVIANSTFSQT